MPDCHCDQCISACENSPGWMTVDEAKAAVRAGKAHQLMCDWWVGDEQNIYVLCPASVGYEGNRAREIDLFDFLSGNARLGTCTFLTQEKRCAIHTSGFKPIICRETVVCADVRPNKRMVVAEWVANQHLVYAWAEAVGAQI